MTEIRQAASVHPQTVTDYSTGALDTQRPRVRSATYKVRTRSLTVHPKVWQTALGLAEGEPWRIQIISETEVMIHNSRDWRKSDQLVRPSGSEDLDERS